MRPFSLTCWTSVRPATGRSERSPRIERANLSPHGALTSKSHAPGEQARLSPCFFPRSARPYTPSAIATHAFGQAGLSTRLRHLNMPFRCASLPAQAPTQCGTPRASPDAVSAPRHARRAPRRPRSQKHSPVHKRLLFDCGQLLRIVVTNSARAPRRRGALTRPNAARSSQHARCVPARTAAPANSTQRHQQTRRTTCQSPSALPPSERQ